MNVTQEDSSIQDFGRTRSRFSVRLAGLNPNSSQVVPIYTEGYFDLDGMRRARISRREGLDELQKVGYADLSQLRNVQLKGDTLVVLP